MKSVTIRHLLILLVSIFLMSSADSADSAEVARWILDDGLSNPSSMTAADSIGSNDGTLQGSPVWTTGQIGGALDFDGSYGMVDFGAGSALDQTGPLSICLWFNKTGANANNNYGHLAGKNHTGGPADDSYFLKSMADDTLLFAVTYNGENINLQGTASVPLGQWHHMAVVYEPSTSMRIYLDGELYAETTSGVPASTASIYTPFTIGKIYGHTSAGYAFNGAIDDVRMFDTALQQSEIQSIMSQALTYAANPSPENGVRVETTLAQLTWDNPEPTETGHVIKSDVLFGTDSTMTTYTQIETGTLNESTDNFNLSQEQTYYWRVISYDVDGSGTVTSASSGPIWSFDTINPEPQVDAGPDQYAVYDNSLFEADLYGQASDEDGFTCLWTVEQQPGGSLVSFDDNTSLTPSVTCDVEGDYVLRLTVTDSGTPSKSSYDEVTVYAYENVVKPFTILALPDTQFYSQSYPQIFETQTQWIADNYVSNNIVFVTHLGDIVQTGTSITQWENADSAMSIIDGVLPYGIVLGNHDMDSSSDRGDNFRTYFGPSRFAGHPGYGGHSANGLNSYHTFQAGGYTFLSLHLDIDIPDTAIDYAQSVIDAHPGMPTIISTHVYLSNSSGRQPAPYIRPDGNSGEDVWNRLVKINDQIFMTINGHWHSERMETAVNDFGHNVYQVQVDYQSLANGGNGWLQMYTFKPYEDVIEVTTYSPYIDEYQTDGNSQFTMALDFETRFDYVRPVARWMLDDGLTDPASMTAVDSAGSNDAVLENYSAAAWTTGKVGGALQFDGSSQNVDAGSGAELDITGELTIMTWFNKTANSTNSYGHLIGKNKTGGSGGDSYYLKSMSNDTITFGVTPSGNVEMSGSAPIPQNQWHHVAAVFVPGQRMTVYVDGQLYSERTTDVPALTKSVTAPFTMAQIDTTSSGYAFGGMLDDVRVYDKALTQQQVLNIISSDDTGPVAYWPLDDAMYDPCTLTAVDEIAGNDGTLTNMTSGDWSEGLFDGALEFDGVDDRVEIPSSSSLDISGEMSLSLWFYKLGSNGASHYSHLAGINQCGGITGDAYFMKSQNNDTLTLGVAYGGSLVEMTGTASVSKNQWHHVVGVFVPGSSMTLYLDGKLYTSRDSGVPAAIEVTDANFTLGDIYNCSGYGLNGLLDEIQLYDRALSESEVLDLYLTSGLPFCYDILAGDLNGDCYVNLSDFGIFASNYLTCSDINNDSCQQ